MTGVAIAGAAESDLGVTGRSILGLQAQAVTRALADAGLNPIIAVGFIYSDDVTAVAKEYADVKFAVVDGFAEGDNVTNVEDFQMYVVGSLTGSDGPEKLVIYNPGNSGSSTLVGRGGDDELVGNDFDDSVDGGAELGGAEGVADAQPCQAVALAERAQDDEVGEGAQQVHRRLGVVGLLELDVGLVEEIIISRQNGSRSN